MFQTLLPQVGFNGALVVILLFMGRDLLRRMFNHWGEIHKEMQKQTFILGLLYEHQTGSQPPRFDNGKSS